MDNNNNYIEEIKKNMDKLISEKSMKIVESKNDNGNPIFKIQFHPPEWFLELDSDMQHNVQSNLSSHYKEEVKNIIAEMNKENTTRLSLIDN
jgi:hypothetical protein